MITVEFDSGTLVAHGDEEDWLESREYLKYDSRVRAYRCEAYRYSRLILQMIREKIPYQDLARDYEEREFHLQIDQEVRPYQGEALKIWSKARQGYIVLPTGAGKSFLALLAIVEKGRDTLVVVPTLDLMHQWYSLFDAYLNFEAGLIGGGYYEIKALTVTTYDSAYLKLENIGNRFGMIVFDECHHLPGETYSLGAQFAIAPFRMGLTATPERSDGREVLLDDLIGPCLYRKGIQDLTGFTLSEYDVRKIYVSLSPEEEEEYKKARSIYLQFIRDNNINFGRSSGWGHFISLSSQSREGRRAFQAYLEQKAISQAPKAKMFVLERLLRQHHQDRILIFTNDNDTVYNISKKFLLPAITHQTRVKERKEILGGFKENRYRAIVTSKVLNEGVDLPEANVGIILSGSGSVREHVQRLGRLLRKKKDKNAVLYEIVARDTSEEYVSKRRGQHEAYQ